MCKLPPGTGLDKGVVLIQRNGEISESLLTMSYARCPEGTFASGLNCLPCSTGRFAPTEGGDPCLFCAVGRFAAAAGAADCALCPAGKYQASTGQSKW